MPSMLDLFLFFLSIVLALQAGLSLLVYAIHKTKFARLNKVYEINLFKVSGVLLLLIYLFGIYYFIQNTIQFGVLLIPAFISRTYLMRYYNNLLYSNNEILYVSAGMLRKSSIKSARFEVGANLERKYGVKSRQLSRFLKKQYLVIEVGESTVLLSGLTNNFKTLIKDEIVIS